MRWGGAFILVSIIVDMNIIKERYGILRLKGIHGNAQTKGAFEGCPTEVDPSLEISEIMDRLVKKGGPAVMFEKVKGYAMPVAANLYGTRYRVNMGLGTDEEELKKVGEFIAFLQRPKPPEGIWEALKNIPVFSSILTLGPKTLWSGPCQEVILTGDDADLPSFR